MQFLDELSQDHRLTGVFGSDICALRIWLLEIKHKEAREYRLLYGWVIPSSSKEINSWSIVNSLPEWKASPYAFRVYQLTVHHSGRTILSLVENLCRGTSLQEACQQTEVSEPLNSPNQPHHCGQFRFGRSPSQVAELFIVRPVIFVETSLAFLSVIEQLHPISSPNEVVPAFVGSLYQLKKLNLLQNFDGVTTPQQEDLAKRCLCHLQTKTGLNFCSADSRRVGNLEWLCFPAADPYENAQVKVTFDTPPRTATIKILPNALEIGTHVSIRCRLWDDREVGFDCLRTIQVTKIGVSTSFTAQQEITKCCVTVWVQSEHSSTGEIWYEISSPILKTINNTLGIVGLQAQFQSEWLKLKKHSQAKKLSKQIQEAQNVTQTHYQSADLGKYQPAPWITEGQQIQRFTKSLFSRPSGGLFIKNGWGADVDEPGIFTFFKWLKSLTDNPSVSKVLIVDPYFDQSGIIEVIARAEATQAEYVVLANTQKNSKYPEDPSQPREPNRATRLKEACSRGDVNLLLSGLKFRLLDLRSTTEKDDQLFHDRCILLFNDRGNAETGYHLSNSIQGATKEHPLLITPIPSDTLLSVAAYVESLLNPSTKSNSRVIQLFTSIREAEVAPVGTSLPKLTDIPHVNFFFAVLLQDNSLLSLDEEAFNAHLKSCGNVDGERGIFEFGENDVDQADSSFDKFAQELVTANSLDFARLWAGLSGWLYRTSDGERYFHRITVSGGEALVLKLKEFLIESPEQLRLPVASYKPDSHAEASRLTELLKSSFPEAIQRSRDLVRCADVRGWSLYLEDQGINYAAQALAHLDPRQFTSTVSELHQSLAAEPENETNSLKLWNLKHTLAFIIRHILDEIVVAHVGYLENKPFLEELLECDIPMIRAISAYSFSPTWNSKICLSEAFTSLASLSSLEQLYTYSEWVFELRIKVSWRENVEDEKLKQIRLNIFKQMCHTFPEHLDDEDFSSLLQRLSGPSKGQWSLSTTSDLLSPLIGSGKLSIERVAEFWLKLLLESLEVYPTSKRKQGEAIEPDLQGVQLKARVMQNYKQDSEIAEIDLQGVQGLELIRVSACMVARTDAEHRKLWVERLGELWKQTTGIFSDPFLRYRNYRAWQRAGICLLWLVSLVNLLIQGYELNVEEIYGGAWSPEQLDELLDATSTFEESPLLNEKFLWEFVAKFGFVK